MAHIVSGNRNGKILVHAGFRYQRNKTRLGALYWKCWRGDCPSRLRTTVFNVNAVNPNIQIQNVTNHNHQVDDAVVNRNIILDEMKVEIQRDPTVPIRRVYDLVLRRMQQRGVVNIQIPAYNSVRSILNRARNEDMPPIPRNIRQVQIHGNWALTWANDLYILHQDNVNGVIVFATDADLVLLDQAECVYVDGTFRSAPRPYIQFFTIHGRVNAYVLKLVCGLLIDKQAPSYELVFRTIDARIQLMLGHQWNPPQIVTDFEGGIISALRNVFPGRPIRGCYFHFAKAVWSHVQELGLVPVFNNNPDVMMIIKKLMAIGFVPLNLIRMNYGLLRNGQNVPALIALFPQLQVFFTYFENTWVNANSHFPPILWNVYQRPMEFRTNNAVESFNRVWNAAVGVRHPSLWLFIRVLKDKQAAHEATKQNMINGVPPPPRRRKWRQLEAHINRLQTQYRNGQRTVDNYWRAVCYTLNRFYQ